MKISSRKVEQSGFPFRGFDVSSLFARENTFRVLPVTRFAFFDSSQQRSLIAHRGYGVGGYQCLLGSGRKKKEERINRERERIYQCAPKIGVARRLR